MSTRITRSEHRTKEEQARLRQDHRKAPARCHAWLREAMQEEPRWQARLCQDHREAAVRCHVWLREAKEEEDRWQAKLLQDHERAAARW